VAGPTFLKGNFMIGQFIKNKRLKVGLSQSQVARRLYDIPISDSPSSFLSKTHYLSAVERDLAPLPPKIISKLCNVLLISNKELIDVMVESYRSKLKEAIRNEVENSEN
jgi:transcriptional regulator with XRE-family HTH domain